MARSDNKSVYQFTSDPNLDTEVQLGPPTQSGVGWYNGDLYVFISTNSAGQKWVKQVDRHLANIVATTAYNSALPLVGWTPPTNPTQGNTVQVKFTDGTVAFFTYNGTVWGLDYTIIPNNVFEENTLPAFNASVHKEGDVVITPCGNYISNGIAWVLQVKQVSTKTTSKLHKKRVSNKLWNTENGFVTNGVSGTSNYEHFATTYNYLDLNEDGSITFAMGDISTTNAVIMLSYSKDVTAYANANYAFWTSRYVNNTEDVYLINNGAASLLQAGIGFGYFKLEKKCKTLTLNRSTDGINFNTVYTYPNAITGNLYLSFNTSNIEYPSQFDFKEGGCVQLFTSENMKTEAFKDINLVLDGNSLGTNLYSTSFLTYLKNKLGVEVTTQNFSVSAQTTIDMLADATTQIDPAIISNKHNILIFNEIGNDLYFNGNVVNAISNFREYCKGRRQAGYTIIVLTMAKRMQVAGNGDSEALYNEKIDRANQRLKQDAYKYADYLVDINDEVFKYYDLGFYHTDNIHWSNEGQEYVAEKILRGVFLKEIQ